jgi:hypothetical protein
MVGNAASTPIVVGEHALPTTLAAAFRYAISILGTFLVARGIIPVEHIEGVITLILTAATVGYGLYKTHQNRKKLIVTADAAPNSVAVVD